MLVDNDKYPGERKQSIVVLEKLFRYIRGFSANDNLNSQTDTVDSYSSISSLTGTIVLASPYVSLQIQCGDRCHIYA